MTFIKENMKKRTGAFLKDEKTEQLMTRSLKYLSAGYPIHFTGPSGTGKTTLALALAKKRKRPVMLMHGNHELTNTDLIGGFTGYKSQKMIDHYIRSVYKKEENVTESWRNGRLLEAVKEGYTLIYDEFTRSQPSTNNIFLSILEEGILPLYGTKFTEPFVKVHPNFNVIFTSNPGEYAGVYEMQDALLDRLITIPLEHKDDEEAAFIIAKKTGVSEEEAKAISLFVSTIREKCKDGNQLSLGPSMRASMMIAHLSYENEIEIDGENEEFQGLCKDILWHSVYQCVQQKEGYEFAEEMILKECEKLSV